MSQTYGLPLVTSTDTGLTAFNDLDAAVLSTVTNFSGSSAPSGGALPIDWQFWIDTSATPAVLKIRNGDTSAWVSLMSDLASAGGGGVLASAAAFTTAAPTSAVAASSGSDLVRKGEVDAIAQVTAVTMAGIPNGGDNRYVGVFPACTIGEVYVVSDTATTGSDGSNNYTIQVRNLTDANDLIATAYTTNGSELAADTAKAMGVDQNLTLTLGDVLEIQVTENGTAQDLTAAQILVVVHYTVAV